jgi:hypothetical protein
MRCHFSLFKLTKIPKLVRMQRNGYYPMILLGLHFNKKTVGEKLGSMYNKDNHTDKVYRIYTKCKENKMTLNRGVEQVLSWGLAPIRGGRM